MTGGLFKRLRWMVIGSVMGTTAQAWARRRLRRMMHTYSPPEVAARRAQQARRDLRAAMDEGREEMRRREAELRGDVHRRTRPY